MERTAETLRRLGDHFTAGFCAEEDGVLGALVAYLQAAPLPEYGGTRLYPLKSVWHVRGILNYDYSSSLSLDRRALDESPLDGTKKREILEKYSALHETGSCIAREYALGGRGFTHFCPELSRFLDRSLPDYLSAYEGEGEFFSKTARLSRAVIGYVKRVLDHLHTFRSPRAARLAAAYDGFLRGAAETFFDAFVRILFVFALDGFDSLGNVDLALSPYPPCGDAKELFSELYRAYEANNAWNFSLGCEPSVAELAFSAFDGASRPNFSLKADGNTPDALWDACFSAMERGARPAFYAKGGYERAFAARGVRKEHLPQIAYGGCTESMIAGCSNVGSIDAGVNLAQELVLTLREGIFPDYPALKTAYFARLRETVRTVVGQANEEMLAMRGRPQYIRTLLCPHCAEAGKEYNAGGAAYYFSVINVCALANAADSLYALRRLVYEEKRFSYGRMMSAISSDFAHDEEYLRAARSLVYFGNDDPEADSVAEEIFSFVCGELEGYRTAIGEGRFLPACIMFDTVLSTGRATDCTPDGRRKGTPVSDSGGAMTGRDRVSPTALCNSLSRICPQRAAGTWVVNVMLGSGMIRGENARRALRALILGYFEKGGNQLQFTVADRETLLAAVDDDELARGILVRVGGFSERFSNLSREFRKNIAERTGY